MKKCKKILAGVLCAGMLTMGNASTTESAVQADHDTIYQAALLQSLVAGYYDGFVSVEEYKQFGDTGIGTFQGVNGELIMLDGHVYQALWDGSVVEAEDSESIPFGNASFFEADITQKLTDIHDFATMKGIMNKVVEENGQNYFYMVKIHGLFKNVLVRSELKQEVPYKELNVALATDQREFSYDNIQGTLVGIYCPNYMNGLNSPGWHLHFISDDKTKGGHMLNMNLLEGEISFDVTNKFTMVLPDKNAPVLDKNKDFNSLELAIDRSSAIKKVEES